MGPIDVPSLLADHRLLAIVRHDDSRHTLAALGALGHGGVRLAEVTTSTPGWQDLVAAAARGEPDGECAGLVVGAGTVTAAGQVREAAEAGARFVVSPGYVPEVVAAALDLGLEPLPGVFTGSEVLAALRGGARVLKLFPAGGVGATYLADLRGPFKDVSFVPTGGVRVADAASWFAAGALALAVGSDLAGPAGPATPADLSGLLDRARAAVHAVARAGRPRTAL